MDKGEDGINSRRSVMHEVYAALAIAALSQERGQKARLSEEEFYAQYSEVPWARLRRFIRAMRERQVRKRQAQGRLRDQYGRLWSSG